MKTKEYRGITLKWDESKKPFRWVFAVNRQGWTCGTFAAAKKRIDQSLDKDTQHNGGNTNLYCDGRIQFVTSCPACEEARIALMKPRWARAKSLGADLSERGFTEVTHGASLWEIVADGVLNGRKVHIEEVAA